MLVPVPRRSPATRISPPMRFVPARMFTSPSTSSTPSNVLSSEPESVSEAIGPMEPSIVPALP